SIAANVGTIRWRRAVQRNTHAHSARPSQFFFFKQKTAYEIFKMMMTTGAELHRAPAGRVSDWHTAPRRQYVITLSGHGELEVAGGKKIAVGPGHIELVEDTTGKGHITRVTGTEERVTLQLPLTDPSAR